MVLSGKTTERLGDMYFGVRQFQEDLHTAMPRCLELGS
jgi:hypothetical protein